MFAVIKTGGKQYRVAADDVIVVEKLAGEKGDTVTLGESLMLVDGSDVKFGGGGVVSGEIVEQRKGEKVLVFKKTRRSTYRRKNGHRQHETVIRITSLSGEAKPAKKATAKKPKAAAGESPAAEA
jgi:large subunit ribosomal protein L21